jgi:hypothetical protein
MRSPIPPAGPGPGTRSPTALQSPSSPIWQAALKKYYAELEKGGMTVATIDRKIWSIQSPGELLAQIESLENAQKPGSAWTKTLLQLQPAFYGLSDFAALTACVMGMNGKVAAVLWSSIRLLAKFVQLQSFPTASCWLTRVPVCPACPARRGRNPRDLEKFIWSISMSRRSPRFP